MANERNAPAGSPQSDKPNQPGKSTSPDRPNPVARPDSDAKPGKQGAEVPGRTPKEIDPDSKKAYGPGGGKPEGGSAQEAGKRSREQDSNIDAPRGTGNSGNNANSGNTGSTRSTGEPEDTVPR